MITNNNNVTIIVNILLSNMLYANTNYANKFNIN